MITSLPSLSDKIENIDASLALVMGELCNLPRYMCINERGVAYRNSQDKFDRFESIRGPEPGHVIVALEVFDRLSRSTFKAEESATQAYIDPSNPSAKSKILNKTRSGGSTEGWIRVAVNDATEKFLPLSLSGERLFERIDHQHPRRSSSLAADEVKSAILELLRAWDRRGAIGGACSRNKRAAKIIGVIQTHLIASVLGRDIASRRPALGILLWYADVFLRRACTQQKDINEREENEKEKGTPKMPQGLAGDEIASGAIDAFISPLLVALRVVLRRGWVRNLRHLKHLMQNTADLFAELSRYMAMKFKGLSIEASHQTVIPKQLVLLLANVASESCNQVLIQFPSVRSKHVRKLMQSYLFQGGLQVGTNGKSLSSILGQIDNTGATKKSLNFAQDIMKMKNRFPGAATPTAAEPAAASVLDELSPPRLRRMSTHLEEDSFLREFVDGNVWTQTLQATALGKDRRARFRRRASGVLADRAERAVVASLIKHSGMLVEAHASMKRFRAERIRRPVSDDDTIQEQLSPRLLGMFLRARSMRDWLQRIKGRTNKSIDELSGIVIERAALLLTVKPSSNVPRLPRSSMDLQELGDDDGHSNEDASMTRRGMVLHEHLAFIRQRSDGSDAGATERDVATDLLMFVMSDELNICAEIRAALQRQQQCAVVRTMTLDCLQALLVSAQNFEEKDAQRSGFSSLVLQALLLPAVQGLRMMWNKKWEMVLPTAGLHLEMKLGNAWKKFFQSLRLVPSLEGSGLSCLRAEILGARART